MFTSPVLLLATLAPAAPIPAAEPAPSPYATPAIGVRADTASCVVTDVYPNMPAGKAGIRPGDRLVRVGTLEPTQFNQVVTHVQTYRPGAVIDVEVDRDGRREVFKLRLVPRPADFDARPGYPFLPGFPNE